MIRPGPADRISTSMADAAARACAPRSTTMHDNDLGKLRANTYAGIQHRQSPPDTRHRCLGPRMRRSGLRDMSAISLPAKTHATAGQFSRSCQDTRGWAMASVDLPQPDSPTSPTASPLMDGQRSAQHRPAPDLCACDTLTETSDSSSSFAARRYHSCATSSRSPSSEQVQAQHER